MSADEKIELMTVSARGNSRYFPGFLSYFPHNLELLAIQTGTANEPGVFRVKVISLLMEKVFEIGRCINTSK